MRPSKRLSMDHKVLRGKLTLLEGLLPLAGGAWFPMRDVTYSIACQLRNHLDREERLLAILYQATPGAPSLPICHLLEEHRDQLVTVKLLLGLLTEGPPHRMDQVVMCASHLIDGLRGHMAREEATMFLLVDRMGDDGQEEEMTRQMLQAAGSRYS